MRFFLPSVSADKQEEVYSTLAKSVDCPVPSKKTRIYSITFRHDGDEWTATVGETLRGHTIADPSARAKNRRIERQLGDSAVVLAIFPGDPYCVFTDRGYSAGSRSAWENPFMAGRPSSVVYFDDG